MPTSRAMLLTHPVRSRILATLMGRPLTTQQIAQLLPDVPMPSIYRHIRLLAEAGVLKAVEEIRINGALTKVYAPVPGQTNISAAEMGDATKAEHLQAVTSFLNTLAETFRGYLEQESVSLETVPLHCLMGPLNLSMEEYRQFMEALQTFLESWRNKPETPERHRVIFAHAALPDRQTPPIE